MSLFLATPAQASDYTPADLDDAEVAALGSLALVGLVPPLQLLPMINLEPSAPDLGATPRRRGPRRRSA